MTETLVSWCSRSAEPRGQAALPEVSGLTNTGLGLPIARGIVEAHGGTLVVAPADPGASFVVALPADPPPDPRSATASEPSGASWDVVEEPEEQRDG